MFEYSLMLHVTEANCEHVLILTYFWINNRSCIISIETRALLFIQMRPPQQQSPQHSQSFGLFPGQTKQHSLAKRLDIWAGLTSRLISSKPEAVLTVTVQYGMSKKKSWLQSIAPSRRTSWLRSARLATARSRCERRLAYRERATP